MVGGVLHTVGSRKWPWVVHHACATALFVIAGTKPGTMFALLWLAPEGLKPFSSMTDTGALACIDTIKTLNTWSFLLGSYLHDLENF